VQRRCRRGDFDRKGVNVPDAVVPVPALTEKDRRDLAFAGEHATGSASPSCSARGRGRGRKLMGGHGALIAKIEKPAASKRSKASSSCPTASWWRAATWASN
jgi:pyruvate kinase